MIKEQNRNVHRITIDCTKQKEHWFLLSSDHHWDNPDSDREMMKRHLEEAKQKNAYVFMIGDFFCAMQGKYDRRASKEKVRSEHQNANYLDSLVSTAADWLEPYKKQIAVIGLGNHETAILKNHETDLIERLVERLNINNDNKVYAGGYGGYIRLNFHKSSGGNIPLNIKYFHGYGGGGPVTKGVIQSYRQSQYFPDADIVISGHVHEQYTICYMQERLSDLGKIQLKEQWHVRMPTYKDEYKDGHSGWHIETGKPPKPIGAWWLKVTYNRVQKNYKEQYTVNYDFIRAK
jgi:hypothetical protein